MNFNNSMTYRNEVGMTSHSGKSIAVLQYRKYGQILCDIFV